MIKLEDIALIFMKHLQFQFQLSQWHIERYIIVFLQRLRKLYELYKVIMRRIFNLTNNFASYFLIQSM